MAERNNPMKMITMPTDLWERIDQIAERWATTRSGALQRLVREAAMPRPMAAPRKAPDAQAKG